MIDKSQPQWYVLKTQYGYEQIAQQEILKMAEINKMQDRIFDVVVPREVVTVETKSGKKKTVEKNKYPNYAFIKMIYTKDVWFMVTHSRGVISFIADVDNKPLPMFPDEVKKAQLEEVKVEDLHIAKGDTVNIIAGPFKDWTGEVVEINEETQTVKVNVQIFGRATDMSLEFSQVEKI